jgi:hypothetical protein
MALCVGLQEGAVGCEWQFGLTLLQEEDLLAGSALVADSNAALLCRGGLMLCMQLCISCHAPDSWHVHLCQQTLRHAQETMQHMIFYT